MSRRRRRTAAVVAAIALTAGIFGCGKHETRTLAPVVLQPETEALDKGASGCGVERAWVKHDTDKADGSDQAIPLPPSPTVETIASLTSMTPPPVTQDSDRFPAEHELVVLKNVHVIAAKAEPDSDLHIIISTPTGAVMNVEAPAARCVNSSPIATALTAARAAIDKALPAVPSTGYVSENVTATIEGFLFFDVLHGQRGAPNGVELHPITCFVRGGGDGLLCPTGSTPTPTPPPLPGCVKYPNRIYFHHVKQDHCEARFFTAP